MAQKAPNLKVESLENLVSKTRGPEDTSSSRYDPIESRPEISSVTAWQKGGKFQLACLMILSASKSVKFRLGVLRNGDASIFRIPGALNLRFQNCVQKSCFFYVFSVNIVFFLCFSVFLNFELHSNLQPSVAKIVEITTRRANRVDPNRHTEIST